jgi:dipeptidyl aminopeptidase/acylaminoacyl peptidase
MKLLSFLLLLLCTCVVKAQDTYMQPPKVLADLLLAPPTPGASINDKGSLMLLSERSSAPTVEDLAQPELRIAGLRINPNNFGPSRTGYTSNFKLQNIKTGVQTQVKNLPANLKAINIIWNDAQNKIAFANITAKGIDAYIIDVATATAKKVNKRFLNFTMGNTLDWENNNTLFYYATTAPASAAPPSPLAPAGPVVQQNLGKTAPSRTFQDLIKNAYDEQLFAFYATSQMVRNTNGVETNIGKPDLYNDASFSPDGNYLFIQKLDKPFSYLVPAQGFACTYYIADKNGKEVKQLAKNPSGETAPTGYDNIQNVPSNYEWSASEPASIIWSEPLDSGLYKNKMEYHDVVYGLRAPFTGIKDGLFKTAYRYGGINWGNNGFILYQEYLQAKQMLRIYQFNINEGGTPKLLQERSFNDAYSDLGRPLTVKNKYGRSVMATNATGDIIMTSNGASAKGDLPLLSTVNLQTNKPTELWRCADGFYESVVKLIDVKGPSFITSKQSLTQPSNLFYYASPTASPVQLTQFTDPQPALRNLKKEKISYKRNDGIDLTSTIYYPSDYKPGVDKPLPIFMWAYPREFKSNADAAQVRGSKYNFTSVGWGSPIFFATQGYVVMDNTEFPIVGEGDKEPNDNFIEQLVNNAQAALNKIHEMKIGDTSRAAVGGHSYGAFMTANLLAHSRLFKAGIARSGAYNRTLTPFGFQNEQRTYWQAPEIYNAMSPFSHANTIKDALLLIHGDADNNPGTFPIQSERLYNAVKGHGGTVRFVSLPFESHGYAAKENLLHMLWEMQTWLDKFVKK